MGCDIHVFTEKRNDLGHWETNDEWETDNEYADGVWTSNDKDVWRNYQLFGLMAGVRRAIRGSFEERGLPDDASEAVRNSSNSWDVDGHTHSYLTLDEMMEKVIEIKNKYILGDSNLEAYDAARSLDADIINALFTPDEITNSENYRLIFWFDN